MNICFIVNKNLDQNSYAFIFPILNNKKFLPHKIEIKNSIPSKNYDIIIIDSKFFIDWFNKSNTQSVIDYLFKLKKKCKKIAYADNEASIYINYKIINNVDYYLKGRLPADIKIYQSKLYGMREFTDFYNKQFNVIDKNEKYSDIINIENTNKIILGWNNGICDYSYWSRLNKNIFKLFGYFNKKFNIKDYKKNKLLNVRFFQNYHRETINFQRLKLNQLVKKKKFTGRINRFKYFLELKKSEISISPFGWGEICYRDFESFYYRCTLVKPDMDHIVTWPNYYIKDETYLSLKWDLSNFEDIMSFISSNKNQDLLKEIAIKGQSKYFSYLNSGEDSYFVKHLSSIIKLIEG